MEQAVTHKSLVNLLPGWNKYSEHWWGVLHGPAPKPTCPTGEGSKAALAHSLRLWGTADGMHGEQVFTVLTY